MEMDDLSEFLVAIDCETEGDETKFEATTRKLLYI